MEPGTILAGRYRAGRTLGAGGMGVVLEGTHLELGTPVAIKLLHDRLALDPERVERFLREARAAAQLRGEHVCRVHDCGTLPGGEPFMVMELLSGCDLSALVDQLGALAPDTVIGYARQACAGVAEAHARGIVHRDIKPTNIFRTHRPDGAPLIKILDFGLAKPMNGQDLSLTQTSAVMGSPRYMSPEQLKSAKVTDPRSDLWSLGVVMYELLAGEPPFNGESITELALNITSDPVPPLPDNVPAALVAVVMRCLEKDPAKRYQSVAELDAALAAAEAPAPAAEPADAISDTIVTPAVTPAVTPVIAPSVAPVVAPSVAPVVEETAHVSRRPRRSLWVVGAAVALASAITIYVATRDRAPAAATPAARPPPSPVEPTQPAAIAATPDAAVEPIAAPADASVQVEEVAQDPRPRQRVRPRPKPRTKADLTKSRY